MESPAPPNPREILWLPGDDTQRIAAAPPPPLAAAPPAGAAAPQWAAAISHTGAMELLAIAVRSDADRDSDAAAAWSQLLFAEPGLSAWAVLRAQALGRSFTTATIAGRWLAAHFWSEFSAWTGRSTDHAPRQQPGRNAAPRSDSLITCCTAWASAAIDAGLARLAAEAIAPLPGRREPDDLQWLYYLKSVFHALPVGGAEKANIALAPAWLTARLESLPVLAALPPASAIEAITSAASQRWLSPPADGSWVPPAVRKLARLAALESRFEQTLQTEKLTAMKELAYGAGHEINNPLANISARAQTLLQDEHDPERRRRLAAINAQAFRAHEMIADLMLFARPPQPKLARIDLGRLVKQVVASIAGAAAEQHTVIHFHCPEEPLYALVDPVQLAVAVRALGVNALESLDQGGRVVLAVCGVGADDEGRDSDNGQNDNLRSDNLHSDAVEITVVDNGPGISSEAAPRIFDPFFSGREAGRGLGFGLSKCWRIVTDHGGRIEARNNPDGGAAFTIRLPRVASAGDDVAQPATEVARPAAASLSAPMGHGEGAGSG